MADEKDMNTESEVKDPLKSRDTNTGNLDKMDDTRTRKTIKLRPTANSPSPSPPIPIPNQNETVELPDPLKTRHTKTGSLHKLDDTRTRKTIKFGAGVAKTPSAKAEKPPSAATDEDTATAKLERPARKPGIPDLVPGTSAGLEETKEAIPIAEEQDTSTVKLERSTPKKPTEPPVTEEKNVVTPDTRTRKGIKTVSPVKGPAPSPDAKTVELSADSTESRKLDGKVDTRTRKSIKLAGSDEPKGPAISLDDKSADSTESRKLDGKVDTRTRKSIKLAGSDEPKGPAISLDAKTADSPASELDDKDDTRTRKTIKLGASAAPPKSPALKSATEDVMPTAAQAKAISPSSQTIKLRPSGEGSAAPASDAAPAAPPSSKDTIKLKPTASAAPAAQKEPAPAPKSTPAPGTDAPGGLRIAGAPKTPKTESAAGGEADSKAPDSKSGLTLKNGGDTTRKGPPRAAKEEAELKAGKKRRSGSSEPSWAYTAFCILMLLCLLFTVFVSAAHYFNTWESELTEQHVGGRIAVPVLDDQIKNR